MVTYDAHNTASEYPYTTEKWEWFAKPAGAGNTFFEFYLPAWIFLILGWLYYWMRSASNAAKTIQTRYNDDLTSVSVVGISRSSASLFLSVAYAVVGIVVHILNGDKFVNAFSIIALLLATAVFRFFRQTHTENNVLGMVPNLFVIVGITLIAMAYANVLNEGDEQGHKNLYWFAAISILLGAAVEAWAVLYRDLKGSDLQDDTAYVVYKTDYLAGVTFFAMFTILELAFISQRETKHYAWPLIFIYAYFVVVFVRILVAQFGMRAMKIGTREISQRSASTQDKVWLVTLWNVIIVAVSVVTTVLGHANMCSSFPERKSMEMCAGLHMKKRPERVFLFSLFAQLALFLFWIGFSTSGLNDNAKKMGAMLPVNNKK